MNSSRFSLFIRRPQIGDHTVYRVLLLFVQWAISTTESMRLSHGSSAIIFNIIIQHYKWCKEEAIFVSFKYTHTVSPSLLLAGVTISIEQIDVRWSYHPLRRGRSQLRNEPATWSREEEEEEYRPKEHLSWDTEASMGEICGGDTGSEERL